VEHEELKTPVEPEGESKPTRKIAVLGSAISSVGLAPYRDPTWEIWACSPANMNIPRAGVWFELHGIEQKKKEGLTEYLQWMARQPFKVYMQSVLPEFPNSVEYPLKHMLEKWGPFWWTSQICYMLALAMEQNPAAIGMYGIDMAANSEYNQQRLACQFFIREILNTGIHLVVPPEADILEPAPLYGYMENSRQWRKYNARIQELKDRVSRLDATIGQSQAERAHLVGALDDIGHMRRHLVGVFLG